MTLSWLSPLPPIIVLTAVIVTQRLNSSLVLGIITAGMVATHGNIVEAIQLIGLRLYEQITNLETLYLFLFLCMISSFIAFLGYTGGALAFAHRLTRRIKTAQAVETTTLALSTALCVDDYLSTLTVGYVMRPMADAFAVPRVKIAYLIHALSGPLVMITPISSWIAMITGQLDQVGIASTGTKIIGDPFFVFVQSIPFTFYSLLTLVSAWFIACTRISFGSMKTFEEQARMPSTENFSANTATVSSRGTSIDLILPIATLVIGVIIGILYTGNYHLLGGNNGLLEAFKKSSHTEVVLCFAALSMLVVAYGLACIRNIVPYNTIIKSFYDGWLLIYSALGMLFFVWTLGNILKNDLLTGHYLASTLLVHLPIALLPAMFYLVGVCTSFIIGSSWGTIALLLPIAIPMLLSLEQTSLPIAVEQLPLLLPVLGAIFSGAVCGDHVSPLSATTSLAATSAGTNPFDHVRTQLPYALPAIISAGISFVVVGYTITYGYGITIGLGLLTGIVCCCSMLYVGHTYTRTNKV